jgi:GT2 family glycosyltransferase
MGKPYNPSMEEFMKVSIIMPVKDNLDITKVAVDSIERYTKDYQLIIVDDGSGIKTTQFLKSIPGVDYIRNEESAGWCRAINQGLKVAKSDLIVFANNDVVVTPGWLEKMEERINTPNVKIGVLGPVAIALRATSISTSTRKASSFRGLMSLRSFLSWLRRSLSIKSVGLMNALD